MPTTRRRRRRFRLTALTERHLCELRFGACWSPSLFPSEEDRRAAWEAHRAAVMAYEEHPGQRPRAWWLYESPQPRDPATHETVQLLEMGAMDEAEIERIKPQWRKDEAMARGRACVGEYDAIRRWAGIPEWFTETEPPAGSVSEQ